ncbi:ABC transporter ATP-binding protein [Listeria newyorkensis]|uniref:ABC transporter ATP-binding protein n=1 Tax=Listeria newyorkensis TaxID=1497681 RepID=A0A841Z177_9LIST|nr:ABC transporter ATP-binding protein [Listeria newyorkensis]MBC1458516.1 ABC transporter ATP-binding protein [Listeria newyorkensis]
MLKIENMTLVTRETLLEDASATFELGLAYGLVAPNGSGKTTLLRVLAGLTREREGVVYLEENNKILDLVSSRRRIFYYESSAWLDKHLSAWDYLQFINEKWANSKVDVNEVIKYWDLGEFAKLPIRKYSLGMKQKAVLAMYAVSNTDYWLMDEPMNGLDEKNQKQFIGFMREAKQRGVCIIFSSHQNDNLHSIADKVYYIADKTLTDTAEDIPKGEHK